MIILSKLPRDFTHDPPQRGVRRSVRRQGMIYHLEIFPDVIVPVAQHFSLVGSAVPLL